MSQTDNSERQLRQLKLNIKNIPKKFLLLLKGKRGRLGIRALSRLTREPGSPQYPLRWQSAKQRRAFFATNGFGRGIPYRRTGKLSAGWQVDISDDSFGVLVMLYNPSEITRYVQYDKAQKFHIDTGWVQVRDVADEFYRDVSDTGTKLWIQACEEVGEL